MTSRTLLVPSNRRSTESSDGPRKCNQPRHRERSMKDKQRPGETLIVDSCRCMPGAPVKQSCNSDMSINQRKVGVLCVVNNSKIAKQNPTLNPKP